MRQVHCPDPSKLYESWTPPAARDENTPDWALQPVTIAVNGTPVLIDVTDHALAFSIAHALYDQPELGLVPVGNVKEGQPYATVTCPQPGNIAIVTSQAAQQCRTTDRQPDPDGPVESIQIPCSVDGQDITVRTNFLFAQRPDRHGSNTPAIYATGRHKTIDPERGDTEPVSLMARQRLLRGQVQQGPEPIQATRNSGPGGHRESHQDPHADADRPIATGSKGSQPPPRQVAGGRRTVVSRIRRH